MSIAKVEPLTTARALRGPFDYRLPEAMAELEVGSVVRVPFGPQRAARRRRRARRELRAAAGAARRAARGARGGRARRSWSRLGLWVAREYCSTPSRGLQLVLPPGTGPGRAAAVRARDRAAGRDRRRRRGGAGRRRAARRQAAGGAGGAAGGGDVSAAELAAAVGADRQVLRRLEAARPDRRPASSRVRRRPRAAAARRRGRAAAHLLAEQQRAVDAIVAALDGEAGAPRELLLHGVTGSGKTEVYLAAVEAALARGRGAIVLVPEIGLAPQAVARFRARLGDRFAVLHSALSPGERYDEWRRLRSGEASVCVGPRSAVFAPVRDLGLIVIDEEHDPSYKQEGDPSLRRPHRRPPPRRRMRRRAASPAPRRRGRSPGWSCRGSSCRGGSTAARCRRSQVLDMREADPRSGPLHPATWEALRGGRARAAARRS